MDMMGDMPRYEVADSEGIDGSSIGLSDKPELVIGQRIEEVYRGFPYRLEFIQQIFPAT